MSEDPLENCIYLGFNLSTGRKTCLIGRPWICATDSSVCGDICPDYQPEEQ